MAESILTSEEVFEAEVGVALSDANLHFQAKAWTKLGLAIAKLWALLYLRVQDEIVLAHLKLRNVPDSEKN